MIRLSLALLCPVPLLAQAPLPRPTAGEIARAVDSLAARIVADRLAPGLGVAVVLDGRTIFTKGYGFADVTQRVPADERTYWYLASTSKSYTGFGVSLLAEQGVLSFEQPISELLPGVVWPAGVDAGKLTLARFLSHTHYLNDNAVVSSAAFTGEIPEARWPELIRLAVPAGNQDLVYSNFGYNVAAMVIDAKRKEGWRRFLDSAVYAPAGLRETYARLSGLAGRRIAKPHTLRADGAFVTAPFQKTDATMNSAGGHVATVGDLARWITVQLDSGMIDGKRAFPAAVVARSHRMLAPQTREQSKRFAYFAREGWGAGWDLGSYEGEPMVSRFGSYHSTRSHLSLLPRRRVGVAAQLNGGVPTVTDLVAAFVYDLEAGKTNARAVAEQRLAELRAQRDRALRSIAASDSTRASRQQPLQRPLGDFAGEYHHPAFGTVRFTLRGEALLFRWGALESAVEVYDAAQQQLRVELAGAQNVAAFSFPGPGPAASLMLQGVAFVRR